MKVTREELDLAAASCPNLVQEHMARCLRGIEDVLWRSFSELDRLEEHEDRQRQEAGRRYREICDEEVAYMDLLRSAGRLTPEIADRAIERARRRMAEVPNPPRADWFDRLTRQLTPQLVVGKSGGPDRSPAENDLGGTAEAVPPKSTPSLD